MKWKLFLPIMWKNMFWLIHDDNFCYTCTCTYACFQEPGQSWQATFALGNEETWPVQLDHFIFKSPYEVKATEIDQWPTLHGACIFCAQTDLHSEPVLYKYGTTKGYPAWMKCTASAHCTSKSLYLIFLARTKQTGHFRHWEQGNVTSAIDAGYIRFIFQSLMRSRQIKLTKTVTYITLSLHLWCTNWPLCSMMTYMYNKVLYNSHSILLCSCAVLLVAKPRSLRSLSSDEEEWPTCTSYSLIQSHTCTMYDMFLQEISYMTLILHWKWSHFYD